jgi:Ala-tRNA(Pro) deacylase
MRVGQFLTENQIRFQALVFPPAFTAQKRAMRLRVSGRQVLKSILLSGPQGYFLAVLPATHRLNTKLLADFFGGPVRLAKPEEIRQVFPDCEWGVVQPLGHLYGLRTILDDSVSPGSHIILQTQTHAEAIRMKCGDFERIEHPDRLQFAIG